MTPVPAKSSWILMPVIDCLDLTLQAVEDCLAQDGLEAPPRVLIVDNGSTRDTRRALEALQLHLQNRVLVWFHNPPLGPPPFGTVNASWNAGLDFCWGQGASEVLVVNNDVRLHKDTYWLLKDVMDATGALFVSAVGVTEEQFDPAIEHVFETGPAGRGGPDFSCFLISRDCHESFPFDPQFHYFGDNDYHRRLKLLGMGDGIFSVNLPYLHFGSRTIRRSPEAEAAYHQVFEAQRERYLAKWGGLPEAETFETPYNAAAGI